MSSFIVLCYYHYEETFIPKMNYLVVEGCLKKEKSVLLMASMVSILLLSGCIRNVNFIKALTQLCLVSFFLL